jgi:succinate dehydrogenase hydrophobic anchor subunit
MDLEVIKAHWDVIQKIYEREEQRRESVEGQAMTLLGVAGLVASIWTGLSGVLMEYSESNHKILALLMTLTFVCILISRLLSLFFALKALKRIPIHILFAEEIELDAAASSEQYHQKVIKLISEITKKNYKKTDFKVDNLKRAQFCFYAGILFILAGGMVTAIVSIYRIFSGSQ